MIFSFNQQSNRLLSMINELFFGKFIDITNFKSCHNSMRQLFSIAFHNETIYSSSKSNLLYPWKPVRIYNWQKSTGRTIWWSVYIRIRSSPATWMYPSIQIKQPEICGIIYRTLISQLQSTAHITNHLKKVKLSEHSLNALNCLL